MKKNSFEMINILIGRQVIILTYVYSLSLKLSHSLPRLMERVI